MAARHIGHGSQLAYRSQSPRLNVRRRLHARRIATISAWAGGSLADVTWFQPRAITRPRRATTAPEGPPEPPRNLPTESPMASRMNCGFMPAHRGVALRCEVLPRADG